MSYAIINDRAWEYYKVAAAAAIPVLVATTISGLALRTEAFVQGAINFGKITTPIAAIGTFLGTRYFVPKKKSIEHASIWELTGYCWVRVLLVDGVAFAAGRYFPHRAASIIATIDGAIALGTLVGTIGGAVIAAGCHKARD